MTTNKPASPAPSAVEATGDAALSDERDFWRDEYTSVVAVLNEFQVPTHRDKDELCAADRVKLFLLPAAVPGEGERCVKCGQPKDPNSAICQRYYEDSARICGSGDFSRPAPDSHCAHCDKDFVSVGKPNASLCAPCFIAGHRGFVCGSYCVVTEQSEALARQFTHDYAVNPELSPHGVNNRASRPAASAAQEPTLHRRFLNWWLPWRQTHNFPHDDRALEDAWIAGFSEHNQITCAAAEASDKGEAARRAAEKIAKEITAKQLAQAALYQDMPDSEICNTAVAAIASIIEAELTKE